MNHNPSLPRVIEVIPHRPPVLWVDGVTEADANSAKGFWTPYDANYDGHFNGMPILQGVRQVEALAQLGAYAVILDSEKPILGLFKGIEATSFERAVRPGDRLDMEVEIVDRTKREFKGIGVASVSGEVACRSTIIGTILPKEVAMRMLGK